MFNGWKIQHVRICPLQQICANVSSSGIYFYIHCPLLFSFCTRYKTSSNAQKMLNLLWHLLGINLPQHSIVARRQERHEDDSVFFTLSLNDLHGVCGHARAYDRMCEFTHNNTDARASTMAQTDHSCTLSWHLRHFVMLLFCCSNRWSSSRVGTVRVSWKGYWSEEGAINRTMEEGFQEDGSWRKQQINIIPLGLTNKQSESNDKA